MNDFLKELAESGVGAYRLDDGRILIVASTVVSAEQARAWGLSFLNFHDTPQIKEALVDLDIVSVGNNRTSMNRTMNQLAVAGIVERKGKSLYVRDRNRLAELAQSGAAQMIAAR